VEQCPWEANRSSANPDNLWTQKIHYRIYKSPPSLPLLSHIQPVPAPPPPSHFVKIRFNIILPFSSGSSKRSNSLGYPTKTLYVPLLSLCVCCMLRLSNKTPRILQKPKNLYFSFNYYSSIPLSLIFMFIVSFPDSRLKEAQNCKLALQAFAILKPSASSHSRWE